MSGSKPRAARVRRTGLALVHVGELVLPAEGSEAQAEAVTATDRTSVHFHFPVEIEVFAGGRTIDMERMIQRALEQVLHGLEAAEEE